MHDSPCKRERRDSRRHATPTRQGREGVNGGMGPWDRHERIATLAWQRLPRGPCRPPRPCTCSAPSGIAGRAPRSDATLSGARCMVRRASVRLLSHLEDAVRTLFD
jgi:hypothetical protein